MLLGASCSASLTHLDLSQNHVSDYLPAALLCAPPYDAELETPPPLSKLNLGFNWIQVRSGLWRRWG